MRIFFITIFLFLNGCTFLHHYPEDNFVEEIVEQIIHQETGLDIDVSPGSPEGIRLITFSY